MVFLRNRCFSETLEPTACVGTDGPDRPSLTHLCLVDRVLGAWRLVELQVIILVRLVVHQLREY